MIHNMLEKSAWFYHSPRPFPSQVPCQDVQQSFPTLGNLQRREQAAEKVNCLKKKKFTRYWLEISLKTEQGADMKNRMLIHRVPVLALRALRTRLFICAPSFCMLLCFVTLIF